MSRIDSFSGSYRFLSNFSDSNIELNGLTYRNAEAAFQAQKDLTRSHEFSYLPPDRAKKLGRRVNLRSDWEVNKDTIMYHVVYSKFNQNEELKQKLFATQEAYLIEGNTWGDKYWGVCNGIGENKLGKILMLVRKKLLIMEKEMS